MIRLIAKLILQIFDNFNQNKILKFLKGKFSNINIFFDIGAHKGESIKIYIKNFKVNKIYSFEPIYDNFKKLKETSDNLYDDFPDTDINIYNFAFGSKKTISKIKYLNESSSSTINPIDTNTTYFKKKKKFLFKKNNENFYRDIEIKQKKLIDFVNQNKIKNIDFMKIDTEGYEYEVLLGCENFLKNINFIIFEHHYHNMLKKNYTYSDINNLLIKNNFTQVFKIKMPFRKTFEYIYEQKKH